MWLSVLKMVRSAWNFIMTRLRLPIVSYQQKIGGEGVQVSVRYASSLVRSGDAAFSKSGQD